MVHKINESIFKFCNIIPLVIIVDCQIELQEARYALAIANNQKRTKNNEDFIHLYFAFKVFY